METVPEALGLLGPKEVLIPRIGGAFALVADYMTSRVEERDGG